MNHRSSLKSQLLPPFGRITLLPLDSLETGKGVVHTTEHTPVKCLPMKRLLLLVPF